MWEAHKRVDSFQLLPVTFLKPCPRWPVFTVTTLWNSHGTSCRERERSERSDRRGRDGLGVFHLARALFRLVRRVSTEDHPDPMLSLPRPSFQQASGAISRPFPDRLTVQRTEIDPLDVRPRHVPFCDAVSERKSAIVPCADLVNSTQPRSLTWPR
jgi:hypothetical protein